MRHIEPELFRWIDTKLALNGLAQHAAEIKDARLLFGLAMEACVGIYEVGGNNNGPMVRLIQSTIGNAVREPWCMALVQSCLAYAEEKTKIISPIYASEHCMTVLRNTPAVQKVKTSPLKYAIIIWQLEGTDSGHTGCTIESRPSSWFSSVEGNSSGDGSRDGDCVGYHRRNWIRVGNLVRRAFLKPF